MNVPKQGEEKESIQKILTSMLKPRFRMKQYPSSKTKEIKIMYKTPFGAIQE